MKNRVDDPILMTEAEAALLKAVQELFASKSDYGDGAEFRVAFVADAMGGYCAACGSGGNGPCFCARDD